MIFQNPERSSSAYDLNVNKRVTVSWDGKSSIFSPGMFSRRCRSSFNHCPYERCADALAARSREPKGGDRPSNTRVNPESIFSGLRIHRRHGIGNLRGRPTEEHPIRPGVDLLFNQEAAL